MTRASFDTALLHRCLNPAPTPAVRAYCLAIMIAALACGFVPQASARAQSGSRDKVVAATGGGKAADEMSQLGPEGRALAERVGQWDVTETVWDRPGAAPVVSKGMVADRHMVGMFLQESLHPAGAPADESPKRMDYLGYDRVEGRWDYLSLETRVPVGLMSAWSFDRGAPNRIVVQFLPFSVAGDGATVAGQTLRMEQAIIRDGPDHDVKDQYFIVADGKGTKWLSHRYDYVRRR